MHLYFHIPFCHLACHYCDFHFSTNLKTKENLVQAIIKEIDLTQSYLKNKELKTIYFGGGTPSLLNHHELTAIFEKIQEYYSFKNVEEISFETNPEDINEENLALWKSLGINRLSIGIQTFDNSILKYLNRNHQAETSLKALDLCDKWGFEMISADLMYGLPGQNQEILLKDIQLLTERNISHISAYNLTIEPGTVFGKWKKQGKLKDHENATHAKWMEILYQELEKQGFENYEISNFARNNQYSKHNTSYWKNEEYLGIGPSAHSFNYESRQWNIANNAQYIQKINSEETYFEMEYLTPKNQLNEYILTNIRTKWGIDLKKLKANFSELKEIFPEEYIHYLCKNELAFIKNEFLFLNFSGKLLADQITTELLIPED